MFPDSDHAMPSCASSPLTTGKNRLFLMVFLTLLALVTRLSVFGDGAYTDDEAFYVLVGQRLHAGHMLYVDVWDRKGPGLFALFYLITALSDTIVIAQIAGLIAATLTAFTAALIADRLFGRASAFLAGAAYLILLPFYGGGAAQSPVFYNLLMAVAALLVVQSRDDLRLGHVGKGVPAAMVLAGCAITFKQTAAVEAGFWGLTCLWFLRAAPMSGIAWLRKGAWLALAGVAPMVACGVFFAAKGHFGAFWWAMVGSNLHRVYYQPSETIARAGVFLLYCAPALALALGGLFAPVARVLDWRRGLLGGWLVASALGVALVPNFFQHYALPFILPASIAAGSLMLRDTPWKLMAVAMLAIVLATGPALRFDQRAQARAAMTRITQRILLDDPHPRLLVFEGPVDLYRRVKSYPPTPLLFPMHLFHPYEAASSPFDPETEMRRVLAWRPTHVVVYQDFGMGQDNPRTVNILRRYMGSCRKQSSQEVDENFPKHKIILYQLCG